MESVFHEDRVLAWENEKVLDLDGGASCTAL